MKREDYFDWDEMFMGIAIIASARSKDPRTQNGAVIVDQKNRIVSVGYNGFPRKCSDDQFPWDKEEKEKYVIHAEINAILNAGKEVDGYRMYLYSERGYYPCSNCAKVIVQSGIQSVYLAFINENAKGYDWNPTKKMFEASGVKIIPIIYTSDKIRHITKKFQIINESISNLI